MRSKIYYEFKVFHNTYKGYYSRSEFTENCYQQLKHDYYFLPKYSLLLRIDEIWEEELAKQKEESVPKSISKRPTKLEPSVSKRRRVLVLEEEDNFSNHSNMSPLMVSNSQNLELDVFDSMLDSKDEIRYDSNHSVSSMDSNLEPQEFDRKDVKIFVGKIFIGLFENNDTFANKPDFIPTKLTTTIELADIDDNFNELSISNSPIIKNFVSKEPIFFN